MRFNCGLSYEASRQRAREYWCGQWTPWFAWYPVRVGECDCRWLETVERKAENVTCGIIFEHVPFGFNYRPITHA